VGVGVPCIDLPEAKGEKRNEALAAQRERLANKWEENNGIARETPYLSYRDVTAWENQAKKREKNRYKDVEGKKKKKKKKKKEKEKKKKTIKLANHGGNIHRQEG